MTIHLSPREATGGSQVSKVLEAEELIREEEQQGKNLEQAAEDVRTSRPDIPPEASREARQNVFARTFDDDQEVRSAILQALPYLGANARKVKRFINVFRLQLLIANRRYLLEDGVIEIRTLGLWLALVGSWPEIVYLLRDPQFASRLFDSHRLWGMSDGSGGWGLP